MLSGAEASAMAPGRRFVDRVLARFGYHREYPPTEMIVFRDYIAVQFAGFRGQRHPKFPHLVAWWPGCGMKGLMMRPIQRVTISESMSCWHKTSEGSLREILRSRQKMFGDDAVWVEL